MAAGEKRRKENQKEGRERRRERRREGEEEGGTDNKPYMFLNLIIAPFSTGT